jgi:hypothetical protein
MHNLRESLLSSTPQGPPELTLFNHRERDVEGIRLLLARRGYAKVRSLARNRIWSISSRYCQLEDGVDSLVGYVHEAWSMYYMLSRYTARDTLEHDLLVLDILRIQGLGPLTHRVHGNYGIDIARTIEGTLWNDLPFLVSDMTEHWTRDCPVISGAQRLNFTSFLAKAASTRVCKDRLCQIGLFTLRLTLEDARDLGSADEPDNEDRERSTTELTIAHLLPSALEWIKEANANLLLLSDVSWNDCSGVVSQSGWLFVESALGERCPTGFSPWRYLFWIKRLRQIKEEADAAGQKSIGKQAQDTFSMMLLGMETRQPGILQDFSKSADAIREDKDLYWVGQLLLPIGERDRWPGETEEEEVEKEEMEKKEIEKEEEEKKEIEKEEEEKKEIEKEEEEETKIINEDEK